MACDICYASKYLRNIFLLTFCLRHSGTAETKLSETQRLAALYAVLMCFLLGYKYICTWYLFGTETYTRTMEIQMWKRSWMWICECIYISYKTTGGLSISSHATNKNSFYYSAWRTHVIWWTFTGHMIFFLTLCAGMLCGVWQEKHQHEQAGSHITGRKIPHLWHEDPAPHQRLRLCLRKGNRWVETARWVFGCYVWRNLWRAWMSVLFECSLRFFM